MLPQTRAPWHHYPVTILTILFYLVGALDYLLTKLRLGFWLDRFSAEQVAYFTEMPFWLDAVWAVGVWGGLLGAYMMWTRNRFSVLFLFIAFAALTFLTVWLAVVHRPSLFGITGFMGVYVMVGTCALAFVVYTYARWERTEYVLT
jgi:hypothetical protein